MKTGKALISEINSKEVINGHFAFWWLGQHSFVVKTSKKIIYLDPFLSDHRKRLVQSLLKPDDVTNADIITGSHDHTDHIDHAALPGIMKSSPQSELIIPKAVFKKWIDNPLPISRIHSLDDQEVYEKNGLKITAIKAPHEFFDKDDTNGYPYLGFIIETNGVVIYHSGDTCIYEGMITCLSKWEIDIAFLPINGRDAKRLKSGCLGNMTYQEAVDLAGTIQPKLTVPTHFEMFPGNTEDPKLFSDYMDVKYPKQKYYIPKHGEMVYV